MVIIAVFPGQGSQTPGFLDAVARTSTARAERLARVLGVGRRRSRSQPAPSGTPTASATRRWRSPSSWRPACCRGTRWRTAAASRASPATRSASSPPLRRPASSREEDALRLVGIRGRAMAEAAAAEQTGMSADHRRRRGSRSSPVSPSSTSPRRTTTAAASSSPRARSTRSQALAAEPPAGTRVIPLQVAGAFHTRYMATGRRRAASARPRRSRRPTRRVTIWSQPRRRERRLRRRRSWICSSTRSPRPCAGTCAWRPSPPRASPASSSSRPPARSPASPSARCAAFRASQ